MIPSPAPGEGWSRLSPRKLLLDPVKAIGQAVVPVVVAVVGISQSDSRFGWVVFPVLVIGPLVFGALPWLTTHYRLTDSQIQVRSGILNKNTSTAPLDRVRSVDLEASLLHRVLGLQKVQVGTGVDDDRITLDALAAADAQALRTTLLRRREAPTAAPVTAHRRRRRTRPWHRSTGTCSRHRSSSPGSTGPGCASRPSASAASCSWRGAVGVLSQFGDDLPIWNEDTARSAWEWVTAVRPGRRRPGARGRRPRGVARRVRRPGTSSSGGASSWCASTGRCT